MNIGKLFQMNLNVRSLAEINQKATYTLFQTLGVVDALKFFNEFTVGSGDYTKEREQWLGELTLDEIVDDITANRAEKR
jgi:hypothetical protein